MIERLEGIVTDLVKHNDTHNVVTLFTRTRGRMAFLVPVGKSKSGKMRNALLSLMAVVGASVNIKGDKELYSLRVVEPVQIWHSIYSNPLKSSLIFFLAEFCNRLLRQYPADARMWDFIVDSLQVLNDIPSSRVANFHIAFLAQMLSPAGIAPSIERYEEGDRFDILSGEMVAAAAPDFSRRRLLLSEDESRAAVKLQRINYSNMHRYRFTRAQRQQTLDRLIDYYSAHLSLSRDFKSLSILRSLFS